MATTTIPSSTSTDRERFDHEPADAAAEAIDAATRATCLAWYEAGLAHGIDIGRRQVHDELAAEWAALKATVMPGISRLPYDELAERRGQPDRAARQRRILHERGIV